MDESHKPDPLRMVRIKSTSTASPISCTSTETLDDGSGVQNCFRFLLDAVVIDLKWCCRPSLRCCFVAAFSLTVVLTGLSMGVYMENWTVVESLYVLVQVVTTIGYGDVTVNSQGMELFMSFYVLCTLVLFSHILTSFVQSWLSKHVDLMEGLMTAPQRGRQHRRSQLKQLRPLAASSILMALAILVGTAFYGFVEPCHCSPGSAQAGDCDPTDLEACEPPGGRPKTVVDSFYMSVITVTTVGFGDYSPMSEEGRVFGIIWCIVGVGCCVNWLSSATEFLMERQRLEDFHYINLQLNEEVFDSMDLDQNGYLTRHEYLGYALVTYGLISMGILDQLNQQFDEMDPKGTNHVTYMDIRKRQMRIREADAFRNRNLTVRRVLSDARARIQDLAAPLCCNA